MLFFICALLLKYPPPPPSLLSPPIHSIVSFLTMTVCVNEISALLYPRSPARYQPLLIDVKGLNCSERDADRMSRCSSRKRFGYQQHSRGNFTQFFFACVDKIAHRILLAHGKSVTKRYCVFCINYYTSFNF